uniref:Hyaluronan/mRNA-binding protein domain-containing protein n=1 Tax=Brassica oleracea TaxID=3712 RepID=A0A3P6FAW3_BRAOL|nr:unnamed protein product [Brassica oleracea]
MATLNPFDLLDDGAEDPSQIAVSIAADKPKKPAPVSAVSAKSSAPSRQLAQPVREARSDAPRGGGRGGGDGGFSRGRAGDGEHPRRTFERHSGTDREGDIKSEEAGCGNWGTPGEEVVVVETEEVAGVETEKPAGDEVAADANKENTAEVEEQKESEDKGSDKDKRKDDKEEKAKKAVNINEFLKPGEGEDYYRGGGRGGRGRGHGGRDGEGASGGGFDGYHSEAAPAIGDTAHFPSLGGK